MVTTMLFFLFVTSICIWDHVEFLFMCLVYLIWYDIFHEVSHFWKWQDFRAFSVELYSVMHIFRVMLCFLYHVHLLAGVFVNGNSPTVKVQTQTFIPFKILLHFLSICILWWDYWIMSEFKIKFVEELLYSLAKQSHVPFLTRMGKHFLFQDTCSNLLMIP